MEPSNPTPSNEKLIDSLVSGIDTCNLNLDDSTNEENKQEKDSVGVKESTNNCDGSECKNTASEVLEENDSENKSDNEEQIPTTEDDLVDELAMKDLELTYTEEDRQRLQKEAEVFKQKGNELFKSGEFKESALAYTQALRTCPLSFQNERSIYYSNRAASKMKLELNESAIEDCTKALELNERYLKAIFRRAQLYEATDKLDEALADYKKILEIDPLHRDALFASKRLPDQIQERNEKLKDEMLGKLKDLGNMFLKPFGLSTENFQLSQDPNSGGYSVNFKN
ncbi:tetratricopeptide repeat protein 1 [Macrosteles quadrilineatus]|uniref:tetratricopeptide repeat protein 1 n=1 Tax=Macrosteles quadrilineatus TaxID=74068 RepID=UPI0023E21024|nr:tetratricopeptide repeat protein 1 [Macrosteles quadrilineatus]XP_054258217.1 tetratricopeptide repeat protein 1 [Macrosteles quadrilineatus]